MRRPIPLLIAALAFAVSCSEKTPTQPELDLPPLFGLTDAENIIGGGGACMGNDALAGGRTTGMQSANSLNCTANDVNLAVATIISYKRIGQDNDFVPWTGGSVSCIEGSDILVNTQANLAANASERYDIGIWLPDLEAAPTQDPSNAVNGKCRHWNLLNPPGGVGTSPGPPSASNFDGDSCGDVPSAATTSNPTTQNLGTLTLKCDDVDPKFPGQLSVGACLGWNNNKASACPLGGTDPINFRYGTTPETKSKCNCTPMRFPITVQQAGSITIIKDAVPNDAQDFGFTGTGTGMSNFSLDDDDDATLSNTQVFNNLIVGGARVVTETPVAGWTLTNIQCTASGATVVIGRIDNGSFVNGGSNGFDAGDTSVQVTLVGSGNAPSCTFTNTKHASLTIIKDAVPDDAQDFEYTTTGGLSPSSFSLDDDADPALSNTQAFNNLLPGTRVVTESPATGWTVTHIQCSANGATYAIGRIVSGNFQNGGSAEFDPGDTSVQVNVAAGSSPSCTFTNTKQGGITIVKNTVGGNGTFNFTAGGSPLSNFSIATSGGTGQEQFSNLPVGTYTVTEQGPPSGWDFTSLSCQGNGPGGSTSGQTATIDLVAGGSVTCTFTNTRRATIVIEKVTVGGAGGPFAYTSTGGLDPSGFDLTTTGAGAANKATRTFANLVPGSYSVTETDPAPAFDFTSLSCQGNGPGGSISGRTANIDLAAGATVTCTYTNTRRGTIVIEKVTVGDFGTAFGYTTSGGLSPSTFDLTTTAAGAGGKATRTFVNVVPGAYSVTENAAPAGWTFTSLSCQGNGAGGSISGQTANIDVAAGATVTCTFTNTRTPPELSIVKTPDSGVVNEGDYATFTIKVSAAAAPKGPAYNVVLTDTLPNSGLSWNIVAPVPGGCAIGNIMVAGEARQLLTCTIGTLAPGGEFEVSVRALIPLGLLQPDAGRMGAPLNAGDGNLVEDGNEIDWASSILDINCITLAGCKPDLASGSGDNSFGNGTDENTAVPSIVSGSIPPNKSDLTRFYIADEKVGQYDYLYLGWRRVQDPSGSTNMDFELNQSTQLSANGVTPVRTAGDLLISYDLANGGTTPVLSYRRWITSGKCGWSSGKVPCWGEATTLDPAGNDVAGSINTVAVDDPFAPNPTSLSPYTFGEARINLQESGIFEPGVCQNFGRAYLKSRASNSPSSALKDFIAPVEISVSSCSDKNLPNTAWVDADDHNAIKDEGLIIVSFTSSSSLFPSPAYDRLALNAGSELQGAQAEAVKNDSPSSPVVTSLSALHARAGQDGAPSREQVRLHRSGLDQSPAALAPHASDTDTRGGAGTDDG